MKSRKILLIRHPEAQKNLEDQHGGEGTSLTIRGIKQCQLLVSYISREYHPLERTVLVGHKIKQVKQTTELLSRALGIKPIWDERICGLDLGVVAGLSRDEATNQWPEAAIRLEKWRQGQLKIDRLDIPYAEPLEHFKTRIERTLNDWTIMEEAILIIAICTRSTLIMLANLIELSQSFSYEHYKAYEFDSGSISEIRVKSSTAQINSFNYLEDFGVTS